jgi:hypothetical protein
VKICPHCREQNPDDRLVCVNCAHDLETKTPARKWANFILQIAGGIVLIVYDLGMGFRIMAIPIPFVLSAAGVLLIVLAVEGILRKPGRKHPPRRRPGG